MLKALRTCLFRQKYLKNECECIFLTFPVSAGRLQLFASQWRKVYFLWQLESLGEVEVHSDDTILQSPLSAAAYIQQQTASAKQSWTKEDMFIWWWYVSFWNFTLNCKVRSFWWFLSDFSLLYILSVAGSYWLCCHSDNPFYWFGCCTKQKIQKG